VVQATKIRKNPFTRQSIHDRLLTAFLATAFPGTGYRGMDGKREGKRIVFSLALHGSERTPKNIIGLMKNALV